MRSIALFNVKVYVNNVARKYNEKNVDSFNFRHM